VSGFKATDNSGVEVHTGDKTCDDAHTALLAALNSMQVNFIGPSDTISLSQQGNLGEFITLHIARHGSFRSMPTFAHNARQPLAKISGAGIDLTYVYFDANDESKDLIYIQEVKTTCASELSLFDGLTTDTKKLFGTDLNLTLQSRIQDVANSFELERHRPDYAKRARKLGGLTPQQSSQVRLMPTGVHDVAHGNPVQKLQAISSAIAALGWDRDALRPWAISLSDLESRLLRLARGNP